MSVVNPPPTGRKACGRFMDSVTLVLRLPSRKTHPNQRTHWRAKAAATKVDRTYAGIMARAAIGGGNGPKWKAATVEAEWRFRTAARRDRDNLLSWLKAYFDGVADSGLLENDSGLTHLPHKVTKNKAESVTLIFTKSA